MSTYSCNIEFVYNQQIRDVCMKTGLYGPYFILFIIYALSLQTAGLSALYNHHVQFLPRCSEEPSLHKLNARS